MNPESQSVHYESRLAFDGDAALKTRNLLLQPGFHPVHLRVVTTHAVEPHQHLSRTRQLLSRGGLRCQRLAWRHRERSKEAAWVQVGSAKYTALS